MLSLVMDTSNIYLIVAIYKDGKCLKSYQEEGSQRQSENAIPALQSLLKETHLSLNEFDEMIITRGPGSYTGVRVAMTIAKTLAAVTDIKIKAISSLAAYAGMNKCISMIDARSQKAFVCTYENGEALTDEVLMTLDELKAYVDTHQEYECVGQVHLVEQEPCSVAIAEHLYALSQYIEPIQEVDLLVPRYNKDVEAKKVCL